MRFLISFMVLVGAVVAGASSSGPAAAVASCGRAGYSYAGFQSSSPAHGVRADLVALGDPQVETGLVAAWVGVGGRGQGAGGSDAWIQVGFSSFQGNPGNLYFEITRPGFGTHYTQVRERVVPGTRYRMAVLEVYRRPGWWKVWVDGAPVSEPVYLPGSSRGWRPIATAETWHAGRPVCNLFSYRFGRVSVAGAGGAWRRFRSGHLFQDPGYRVVADRNGFLARTEEPLPPAAVARALAQDTASPAAAEREAAEPDAATPEAADASPEG